MKLLFRVCLFLSVLPAFCAECLFAANPKTLDVRVDGRAVDVVEPLPFDTWHTVTARYQYGDFGLLTNTYMILARTRTGCAVRSWLPSSDQPTGDRQAWLLQRHGSHGAAGASEQDHRERPGLSRL